MNFVGKVSLAIPFVAAVIGALTARLGHAGGLATAFAGAVGFIVGVCFGALTAGLSNAMPPSSDRTLSVVGAFGFGLAYLVLPAASLAAASTTTFCVVKWML